MGLSATYWDNHNNREDLVVYLHGGERWYGGPVFGAKELLDKDAPAYWCKQGIDVLEPHDYWLLDPHDKDDVNTYNCHKNWNGEYPHSCSYSDLPLDKEDFWFRGELILRIAKDMKEKFGYTHVSVVGVSAGGIVVADAINNFPEEAKGTLDSAAIVDAPMDPRFYNSLGSINTRTLLLYSNDYFNDGREMAKTAPEGLVTYHEFLDKGHDFINATPIKDMITDFVKKD